MATQERKTVSREKLAELRAKAPAVRAAIARDMPAVKEQAREVIDEAVSSGKLFRVAAVFRADEQPEIEAAMDQYAKENGLQSRSQVLRLALRTLLKLDLQQPQWGRVATDK